MQGLKFVVVSRKAKCRECQSELPVGTKTAIIGSHTNQYRYCLSCFAFDIEQHCYIIINDGELILE
jgi:hypothetical protein